MSEISGNKHQVSSSIKSKHRLAEISHHFLSNKDDRTPAWQHTTTIPVLLGSKRDDYIAYELNRHFNRHDGKQSSSSMVLNIENRIATSSTPVTSWESLADSLSPHQEENGMPDYCLVPVTSPSTTMALQCDRFIIAVHASLGGVRIAYDQLAFMASLETDFNVCVIMLDAKNIRDGERFFGFLCDNAKSLLALDLECGGLLLQDRNNTPTAKSTTNTEPRNHDFATDLDSVASGILQKFTSAKKTITSLPLAPPAGVMGLLS